jgi:hypothetical protein
MGMTREGRPIGIGPEDSDDRQMADFRDFINKNDYTADQMREAYYQLVGVSDKNGTAPEVNSILGRMREMVEKRFPLNRLAALVEAKQDYEDVIPTFHAYIDTLEISTNEKGVLRSIIDKERSGEVICLVNGDIIGEIKINFQDLE